MLKLCRRSRLRKPDVASLGPQYKGSRISRDDLLATGSESEGPFGSDFGYKNGSSEDELASMDGELSMKMEDEDEFTDLGEELKVQVENTGEGLNGHEELEHEFEEDGDMSSSHDGADGENFEGQRDDRSNGDDDDSEMEEVDSISGASMSSSSTPDEFSPSAPGDDRAALRQMMAESQKSVIATISAATKADLAKGKAIKQQRSAFDALLNTRIRLQKALVATNSFSLPPTVESPDATVRAAESAALSLWTQLDSLRQSLHPRANPKSQKRPFSATLSTQTSELWACMQTQGSISTPHNRAILAKWSSRLHPPGQLRSSLSTNSSSQMPLPVLIDQHLSPQNITRLIERTRIPRFCAPLQASTRHHPASDASDAHIYDDADFYTLLLRDLVDRRMADPAASSHPATSAAAPTALSSSIMSMSDLKAAKRTRRANVDTKASKGRKMRYAVHEKLRDFMVREDRGTWGERRVEELFGSLLGRQPKVELGEGSEEEDMDEEGRREENGLMLFRR